MRGAHLHHSGILSGTLLHALIASFLEVTVVRHIHRVGNVARYIEEARVLRFHRGLRFLQALRVRMAGMMENFRSRSLFDNPPCVHYNHIVRHFRDNAEVVRDEQNRTVDSLFQVVEQFKNLRLYGNVQRGGRFVGNNQTGFAGKRHGYHDALPPYRRKVRAGTKHTRAPPLRCPPCSAF